MKDQLGIKGLVFQEASLRKREASRDGLAIVVREMDMRCPNCNSTNLKKVFLAYEEGLFRSESRTRIRGVSFDSGGPHIIVGHAATKGTHQTMLSERLSPHQKWSYLKLLGRFVAPAADSTYTGTPNHFYALQIESPTVGSGCTAPGPCQAGIWIDNFGSGDSIHFNGAGPIGWTEGSTLSVGTSSTVDRCYGDSTAHALKCSYNNGAFLPIAQAITTSFTTTAATTDNVPVTGMTSSGHCALTPTNSGATGGIASVFISAKTTNQITVTHTATSGWTFDVICFPQ